jgi:hypothetical protein
VPYAGLTILIRVYVGSSLLLFMPMLIHFFSSLECMQFEFYK